MENKKRKKGNVIAQIVIIGAGLTGLSTAYYLEKNGFFDYKIFEKESEIGGLCRSVFQDEFIFDYTGHLLHINNHDFLSFIETITKIEQFNKIVRNSFVYSHNVFTPYPFQMNLYGLPDQVITECIEGFVTKQKIYNPKNYRQWVVKHFGQGLGKHFFFPYQKKIFSYDIRKLKHTWTSRFVPSTSLEKIIHGAIINQPNKNIGYNSTFFYPTHGGISFLIKKVKEQLLIPIATNFCAKKVDLQSKLVYFANGHIEPFKQLVSTMPLNLLLKNIKEKSSTNMQILHKKLLCNSVVNFNIGTSNKSISDKNWIYFPEKKSPFYRIGFPHTFSKKMAPKNCSSLYGELSYLKKSKSFVQNQLKIAIKKTMELFNIKQAEIITKNILNLEYAYVIYNEWREKNLNTILKKLSKQNVFSVGRYGAWKYSSMQEAVLDGKKTAEKLLCPKQKILFVLNPKKEKIKKNERIL